MEFKQGQTLLHKLDMFGIIVTTCIPVFETSLYLKNETATTSLNKHNLKKGLEINKSSNFFDWNIDNNKYRTVNKLLNQSIVPYRMPIICVRFSSNESLNIALQIL